MSATVMQHGTDAGPYLGLADKFEQFIVVSFQPFTQRNLQRFGANWLLERKKDVRLVDVSLLVWDQDGQKIETGGDVEVVRPDRWEQFEQLLRDKNNSLLLPFMTPRNPLRALPIFELAASLGTPSLYFEHTQLPRRENYLGNPSALLRRAARQPFRLLSNAVQRMRARRSPKFCVEYLVMGSKACEVTPPAWIKETKLTIPSHGYDYVVWDTAPSYVHGEPYVVFLDQAYPDHTDPIRLKMDNPFRREVYYPAMRHMLQRISSAYRMPVIVALHPRALVSGNNPYEEFKTVPGRTASLVKGAAVVIAHDTAAISFAVLSRKPLMLLKLEEMQQWQAWGMVDCLAKTLGLRVVNLNEQLPLLEELMVDESKYAHYETMYLRHPSCNGIHVWDRIFGSQAG